MPMMMWDYMDSRPPGVNTIPEYPPDAHSPRSDGVRGQMSTRGRTRAPEEGTRGWNGAMRQRGEYRVRKGRRERQCVVTERACELAADRVQVCLWK